VITKAKDIPLGSAQQVAPEQMGDSGSDARSAGLESLDNSDHLNVALLPC
jgi:hypothetical protein